MSDTLRLLATRRSIPAISLAEPAPDDAAIRNLITIAARVPDHGKLAPWRFVLYRKAEGEAIGAKLAALYAMRDPNAPPERLQQERNRFLRAPIVIGVVSRAGSHPKIPEWEQVLSVGASAMNLVMAANAMGFAAQWLTEWYAYDDEASAYLGRQDGERFAGFIHIGTPTEPPFERPRPEIETILTEWKA